MGQVRIARPSNCYGLSILSSSQELNFIAGSQAFPCAGVSESGGRLQTLDFDARVVQSMTLPTQLKLES